jgi:hypothetical protein
MRRRGKKKKPKFKSEEIIVKENKDGNFSIDD